MLWVNKKDLKAHSYQIVKQICLTIVRRELSLLFWHFINTTATIFLDMSRLLLTYGGEALVTPSKEIEVYT